MALNPTPDFAEVVDASLRAKPQDRGDEHALHFSDGYGCDRATWSRRRGLPQLPFDAKTLVKFEMGKQVEATVNEAIRAMYPGDSEHNRRVIWFPDTGEVIEIPEEDVDAFQSLLKQEPRGIVGHLDVDLDDRRTIEVKSTVFYGKPPARPSTHYIEQSAMQAAAWNAPSFGICVVCRSTGDIRTWWFDTDAYLEELGDTPRAWAKARAKEMLMKTDPEVPFAPQPAPRTPWQCKTCRYSNCSENKNPARFDAPVDLTAALAASVEAAK